MGVEIGTVPVVVRARTPDRLPVVLSREEIGAVLKRLASTMRLVVMLLYGSGVRLEECLNLRMKDLDFDRHQISVRQGKGQKDRATMLPSAARDGLTTHLADVRRIHEADLARGFGRVVLPFALDRKFPNASTDWRWQFVFPATRICHSPQFGLPSRYHLHESVVQKAVAHGARLAGITKRVGPHVMRHSFATLSWKTGTTFGPCKSSSGIETSGQRYLLARDGPWSAGGEESDRSAVMDSRGLARNHRSVHVRVVLGTT